MTIIKTIRPFGFFSDFFCETPLSAQMRADVKETENAYVVEAELPGVKKENVELICKEGVLTVTAKAPAQTADDKTRYLHRERNTAEIMRRFEISGIDEENISAKLEDGVLCVTLPKKAPEKNEKHITIE